MEEKQFGVTDQQAWEGGVRSAVFGFADVPPLRRC